MININNSSCLNGYFVGLKVGTALLGISSLSMFSQTCEASVHGKPNIVFILTDDLGYGDLSYQGGKDIRTPNIDQIFSKGIRFTNFYANSTVSSPTRASLITGRYPDMVGVPGLVRAQKTDNWGYLLPNVITLPDMLKKAGYQTAIIGKWNLGLETPNLPNERGFDFFHGFLNDMMDDYWTHLREGINYMRLNDTEIDPQGHATDIFSDWAVDYIREKAKEKEPFFLYLAYNAPHFPIQPPDEWLEKVKKREVNLDEKRAKNIALVEHLDGGIGRVIDALKKSGQYENTIIIFSSDNGGHLPSGASNGNLRGGKMDMYEGGIKVPTCMVWEGTIKPGSVSDKLGLMMDFYPTICSLAGISVLHTIDGVDLLPGLLGKISEDEDNRMVCFVRRDGGNCGGLCYYAARKGVYKLVQNTPFEEMQLFNIEIDPQEKTPLDVNSEQFIELKFGLSQHIRKAGAIPWQKDETK
jgi:arylsulfatase A-like enzyme